MASSSSFTPSSSSPTNMKATQFSRIQQTPSKKPNSSVSSSKATSLIKRQETVFKKAQELSVLCGIEVCVICYGSDGKLKTWPEDREKVKDIARRYSELSDTKRRKRSVDLHEFLEKVNKEDAKMTNKDGSKKKKRKVIFESKVKYPVWDPRFDNYSVEKLTKLIQSLEGNLTRIQHRFSAVVEAQGQRKIQNTNLANQELMMNSPMNHPHQQYSNQVSMYLFNHGTGTLSQVQVPASALNQAQSLAPIPPALQIYPNMGNYSGSLGIQETGVNGFQNMNMFNYNNNINGVNAFLKQIGQNPKVESYPGLLGVQENGINGFGNTNMDCYSNLDNNKVGDYLRSLGEEESGTNGLQNMNMNMNMHMYNNSYNANGLSHQLVQYPTQTTAPGFQFGSVQKQY
ncbi:Agamous-like MADS-box protein [Cardamine amara subsp. amara]|uniref:Agamous-like MADS-box protein n=1 Tax=Cardamine amara subsp. amara TaxID=228776 RepID=A0ABD1BWH5_CARAN